MPARRKSPRRSKSRSKSPRRVLKRRSSGKARTSVTRRRSPKRTYKGTDTRLYGMQGNPPIAMTAARLRRFESPCAASQAILEHLRTGPIGALITQLENKLTTNDDSELYSGDIVEIAPVDNVPPLTGTVVSQTDDLVTVKVSETEEKQYLRQFLQKR